MPAFDGTGPQGMGPLTGRGFGPCGRGFRRGWGCGLGRFFGRFRPQSSQTQTDDLTDYVKSLEEEVKLAKEELSRLAKDQKK